jgi:hypothetical protein
MSIVPEDLQQLLEELGDAFGLRLPARDRDLVAADVDLGVEPALDDLQQLVVLAQQGEHRLAAGNEDLHLGSAGRHGL